MLAISPWEAKKFNLFGNLKSNNKFENFVFRFGANHFGSKCQTNNRLESSSKGYTFTHRTLVQNKNLLYGFVGSVGLGDFSVQRFNALVGYEKDNFNFYVQEESSCDGKNATSKILGGKVTATAVYSQDKQTFGAQFAHTPKGNTFQLAVQRALNDGSTFKLKFANNLDLSFAFKKRVNSLLTFTAAGNFELQKGGQAINFGNFTPIPLGFQFDLNI